jgi:hypothetical protein
MPLIAALTIPLSPQIFQFNVNQPLNTTYVRNTSKLAPLRRGMVRMCALAVSVPVFQAAREIVGTADFDFTKESFFPEDVYEAVLLVCGVEWLSDHVE